MERKYNYLEKVIVLSNVHLKELEISGCSGTILGFDFVDGNWIYSIDIKGKEVLYSISELDIITTGEYDDEAKYY